MRWSRRTVDMYRLRTTFFDSKPAAKDMLEGNGIERKKKKKVLTDFESWRGWEEAGQKCVSLADGPLGKKFFLFAWKMALLSNTEYTLHHIQYVECNLVKVRRFGLHGGSGWVCILQRPKGDDTFVGGCLFIRISGWLRILYHISLRLPFPPSPHYSESSCPISFSIDISNRNSKLPIASFS